jgi:hypothetical protein
VLMPATIAGKFFKIANQKMSKTFFFKWQLDINVKFNSKPTFINIVYAYSQLFGVISIF